jgi:hypothetical protein
MGYTSDTQKTQHARYVAPVLLVDDPIPAISIERVMDAVRPMIEAGASLHWLVPFQKFPRTRISA